MTVAQYTYKVGTNDESNTRQVCTCETRTVGHCLHRVPIDVTAGWAASPVGTRPPGSHLTAG